MGEATIIRPGDKLVVRTSADLSQKQADEWRAMLAERLPGVDVTFIVADQLLVYRPEASDV